MSSALYLETSALVAWLFGEANGASTARALNQADTVVTSALTLLEVERVLVRFHAQGGLNEAQYKTTLGAVKRATSAWVVMEISRAVRKRAALRFAVEPVRSLDAIHLATALEFAEAYSDLRVLSFDQRVLANLSALGLAAVKS